MAFCRWASSSLLGHVVLFEVILSLPLSIVFLELNYSRGTLTVPWALDMSVIWGTLGVAVAVLGWYTVSLPLIRLRKSRFPPGRRLLGSAKDQFD
jgi:hypothetical protein